VLLSLRRPEGRYSHGVRHLQSLSRFEETLPEVIIELFWWLGRGKRLRN
jgi:hypothetical protein